MRVDIRKLAVEQDQALAYFLPGILYNSGYAVLLVFSMVAGIAVKHEGSEVMLLLNRRGFSSFVACRACGEKLRDMENIRADSTCARCGGDLHACRQCASFDTSARFECTRPIPARIDRLPDGAKRLLQSAAVVGTDVPLVLLQEIADGGDGDLPANLAALPATNADDERRPGAGGRLDHRRGQVRAARQQAGP